MTVRIREILIRYEDDGEITPLSAAAHHEKFAPLRMEVHHHCAPAPMNKRPRADEARAEGSPEEYKIDLNKVTAREPAE